LLAFGRAWDFGRAVDLGFGFAAALGFGFAAAFAFDCGAAFARDLALDTDVRPEPAAAARLGGAFFDALAFIRSSLGGFGGEG
jgi:hypothetical protein